MFATYYTHTQYIPDSLRNSASKPAGASDLTPHTEATQSKRTISESEFVSDTFQTTDKDLEEVKAGMKRLGIDTLAAQQSEKDGKTRPQTTRNT